MVLMFLVILGCLYIVLMFGASFEPGTQQAHVVSMISYLFMDATVMCTLQCCALTAVQRMQLKRTKARLQKQWSAATGTIQAVAKLKGLLKKNQVKPKHHRRNPPTAAVEQDTQKAGLIPSILMSISEADNEAPLSLNDENFGKSTPLFAQGARVLGIAAAVMLPPLSSQRHTNNKKEAQRLFRVRRGKGRLVGRPTSGQMKRDGELLIEDLDVQNGSKNLVIEFAVGPVLTDLTEEPMKFASGPLLTDLAGDDAPSS